MKMTKNIVAILALLTIVLFVTTCSKDEKRGNQPILKGYDRVFDQWTADRKALTKKYQHALTELQNENIALKAEAQRKKSSLAIARERAVAMEQRMKDMLTYGDSSNLNTKGMETANEYFAAQADKDIACDQTIDAIENQLANRDSVIVIKDSLLGTFRDLQKEQAIQTQILTEELNTAYKIQRRKGIQNKWLTCGMIFLSGITTTILINRK